MDGEKQTATLRNKQKWTETDRNGQILTNTDKNRQKWTKMDRNGQTRTETEKTEEKKPAETDRNRNRYKHTGTHRNRQSPLGLLGGGGIVLYRFLDARQTVYLRG